MNEEKIVAEQQHGRNLYKKLMIDFREELQKGNMVGIESKLPEEVKHNIKIGVAFEALEQKDYRTAEAFFAQLGDSYKDWKKHATELSLEETAKAESKPLTLVDKIERIDVPKIKFEYAQERIREIAGNYSIVKEVIGGQAALEGIAEGYEKEFESLCKLKKREFKNQAKAYSAKLIQLEEMLKGFTGLKLKGIEAIEDCQASKIAKAGENILGYSTIALLLGGAGTCFVGMVTANPLVIGLGLSSLFSSIGAVIGACEIGEKFGKNTERMHVKKMFSDLKKSCKKADKTIQEAFVTEFYWKNTENFKNVFNSLKEADQRYAIREILKMKESNKEANSWLLENYKQMIEEEGMTNICVQEIE